MRLRSSATAGARRRAGLGARRERRMRPAVRPGAGTGREWEREWGGNGDEMAMGTGVVGGCEGLCVWGAGCVRLCVCVWGGGACGGQRRGWSTRHRLCRRPGLVLGVALGCAEIKTE